MGGIQADNGIGGHVLHCAVTKSHKGILQGIGGRQRALAELVAHGPCALRGHLGGKRCVRIRRGNARICIEGKHRDARRKIGRGNPVAAVGVGRVDAHDHIHLAVGNGGGRVGPHIHDGDLQTQLVGDGRGNVHIDADDLAAAHAGQRRVLGVDAHAQRAFLADHRGRHLCGFQLGLVGTRTAATCEHEGHACERRPEGGHNEPASYHFVLRLNVCKAASFD